jgi:hypothetical protein
MGRKLAAGLALLAILAGCGGGVTVARIRNEPWDRPLVAPSNPAIPAEWAEGVVAEVSGDGKTVTVQVSRGEVRNGDRISIFVNPSIDPGAHYLDSETRGTRAAHGKILSIEGDTVQAEILDSTWHTPIEPGDPVVIRYP